MRNKYFFNFGKIPAVAILAVLTFTVMKAVDTSQSILNPKFKTLRVEKENNFLSSPVISLQGNEHIVISFDEIGEDFSRLQFRLIHCNSDWQPSRLIESEFLDGFNYDDIDDYAFSSNTFVNYVNYRFTIPSERIKPIASGNYIAEVYPVEDPDSVILRARFQISEDSALITGECSPRTDMGYNSEWQQLILNVNAGKDNINPYSDLIISINQNRRPETEHFITHPMRVDGRNVIYDHQQELIYPASNEYRRFETVRADYPGMNVEGVDFKDYMYQATLKIDNMRSDKEYIYDQTQFGRFMIDEYNSTDPDLGADYVMVHFKLDFPELINGDIYVDGDFTNHTYNDEFKMKYDRESRTYNLSLPLKQGSYNYQYIAKKKGENEIGTTQLIEGNKYETINEYNISVFYRPAINRADKLLGTATIYSIP